jgi:hypothetical protein
LAPCPPFFESNVFALIGGHAAGRVRARPLCPPYALLFEGASGSSPGESGMPQDIIDFMESPEGVRFVAAFGRITDPKLRRGIARLANRIADGMQPKAMAGLLQLKEPTDEPADNT